MSHHNPHWQTAQTDRKFIASVDVGTTSIRCFFYDENGSEVTTAMSKLTPLYPHQGWNELDPEEVWSKFQSVVKSCLQNVDAKPTEVKAFSMATQRGTFVTWDKQTGKTFHNLITWKDLRADHLVKAWNNSWTMAAIRAGSSLLHMLTRNKRYLAGTVFKFLNGLVCMRLRWILDNDETLRKAADQGYAAMGTIDSFLLNRMTCGKLHATDYSNVCVTGLFDPYAFQWVEWMADMLSIPKSLFPEIKDSVGDWGCIDPDIFGAEIPIRCIVSDQGASMFGSFCFQPCDVRLSMGTGSFLSFNTGDVPHTSITGLYPTVAWKIRDETVFVAEGQSSDTATVIDWCRDIGLFNEYDEINDIVSSVKNSQDVFFVPAFSGIQAPVNDETVATGFIGVKPSTTKNHLLRAAIESLGFRVYQMCLLMYQETGHVIESMRVDGGVSRNDFLMQLISDLTLVKIERPGSVETAALGAALMAGLEIGMWKSRTDLMHVLKIERTFTPDENRWLEYAPLYNSWKNAVERLGHWY